MLLLMVLIGCANSSPPATAQPPGSGATEDEVAHFVSNTGGERYYLSYGDKIYDLAWVRDRLNAIQVEYSQPFEDPLVFRALHNMLVVHIGEFDPDLADVYAEDGTLERERHWLASWRGAPMGELPVLHERVPLGTEFHQTITTCLSHYCGEPIAGWSGVAALLVFIGLEGNPEAVEYCAKCDLNDEERGGHFLREVCERIMDWSEHGDD